MGNCMEHRTAISNSCAGKFEMYKHTEPEAQETNNTINKLERDIKNRLKDLEKEEKQQDLKVDGMTEKNKEIERLNKELVAQKNMNRKALENIIKDRRKLKKELIDMSKALDSTDKIKQKLDVALSKQCDDIMKLKNENESISFQYSKLCASKEKVDDDLKQFTKQKQMEIDILEEKNTELKKLKKDKNELLQQIKSMEYTRNKLQKELQSFMINVKMEMDDRNNELVEENGRLKEEINNLRSQTNNNINVCNVCNGNMDRLMMKKTPKDDEKKIDNEEICKLKFKNWLSDTVKLKQYLSNFAENECNDIRMIEFLDDGTIINDIGIRNKIHRKLIIKQIKDFKKLQFEFSNMLNNNHGLKQCKQIFESNGILTLKDLQNDIQTKQEFAEMLNTIDGNTMDDLWITVNPNDDHEGQISGHY